MGLTLLFAVVMQIMANFINDYVDFINGTDDETRIDQSGPAPWDGFRRRPCG